MKELATRENCIPNTLEFRFTVDKSPGSAPNDHTPYEKFLLASTPFVAQVLENDTLLTIFNSLEEISDVGVEVYYLSPEDSTST